MLNKKTKIKVSCILSVLMTFNLFTIAVSAAVTNAGTYDEPYEIRTAEDLLWFAEQVNSGETAICGKLMNDIELNPGYTFTFQPDTGLVKVEKTGEGLKGYFGTSIPGDTSGENETFDYEASWKGYYYESDDSSDLSFKSLSLPQCTPIGTNENRYTGTFDGNCKTVSGLFINSQNDYVALFGAVGFGGTVKKVTVANSYICGNHYIGGICGDNVGGTIINCSSSAIILGNIYVGGICGNLSGGSITSCYNIGKISGSNSIGSVLGNNSDGTVANCYYLTGSAIDTKQTPQFGIGNAVGGSHTADISGSTAGKTAEEFADGSVTYALNSGIKPVVWYQKNGVPTLIPYTPAKVNDNGTPSNTLDDYCEIKTAEDLFWFAAQTNGLNSNINGKLMNDINLNPDYTFTFQPDTGLVKVEKAGGTAVYLGTGIKGESGGIDTFDAVASLIGKFYLSNMAADTTTEPADLVKWTPISEKNNYNYHGTFDGCGYVIKNLYINNPNASGQGLFGHPARATIRNLGLLDCNIIGNDYVGGFVGQTSYASVNNCFVTGVVAGNEKIGGIYGSFGNNYVEKIISAARVLGTSNVGVIAGNISGSSISDSIGLKNDSIPLFGTGTNNGTNVIELSDLSTGEACWFLNGNSSLKPTWFQNIGEGGDECPLLDSTHGIVYQTNDGYASCNEHIKDSRGFCSICGVYLSDGFMPNEAGFFEIDNAEKLLWFSYYVEYKNSSANAILTSDIDLSEVCGDGIGSFKPIGNSSTPYKGKFDGNNHTVSNLYINNSSSSYSALFGNNEKGAEITDITIENADITCTDSASILVGSNSGLISHCSVEGNISVTGDYKSVGGVCSINSFGGTITDCYSKATVTVNGANNNVGGVCGKNASYNFGTVITSTVTGCMDTGSVTATGDNNKVGPVIGNDYNPEYGVVTNNYYLDTSETDSFEGTTFKTEKQFISGEVAYLLNNGVTDGTQPWYQNCYIGYPEIKGETIYSFTNCMGQADYANLPELDGTVGRHNDYINGICIECGEYMAAVLNNGVYEIGNAGQLMWFTAYVNGGNTNVKAALVNDINMANLTWPGIASYSGTLDGKGYTINNLNVGTAEEQQNGFIITLESGSFVQNLNFNNAKVFRHANNRWNAVIAEKNNGTIQNCMVSNSLIQGGNFSNCSAAIAAQNNGTIDNCAVIDSTIVKRYSSNSNPDCSIGGISRENNGTIQNCYAYNITLSGTMGVKGAIVATGAAPVNSYYTLNDESAAVDSTVDGISKFSADFADGTVAYLLNNGKTDGTQIWYQNIDNGFRPYDDLPKFTGGTVYSENGNYTNCKYIKSISDSTSFNEVNKYIYTDITALNNVNTIIAPCIGYNIAVTPSLSGTNYSYCGTGSIINISSAQGLAATYTLVVMGDINGDSVTDAFDVMAAELALNTTMEPASQEFKYYDADQNDVYDANDYQLTVNRALSKQ